MAGPDASAGADAGTAGGTPAAAVDLGAGPDGLGAPEISNRPGRAGIRTHRPPAIQPAPPLAITLRQRTAEGLWDALRERLQQSSRPARSIAAACCWPSMVSCPSAAVTCCWPCWSNSNNCGSCCGAWIQAARTLQERWIRLQPELRRRPFAAWRAPTSSCPRRCLAAGGGDPGRPKRAEFDDPELPDPQAMLSTLLQARPLLVDGRLVPPDEPQALIYLELLLANWLVRSAEIISAEVLAACASWPELRRYLLRPELLPTRNLERLRNQLNAQQRWISWIDRPIHLYESRRPLFQLSGGAIQCVDLTEPRRQGTGAAGLAAAAGDPGAGGARRPRPPAPQPRQGSGRSGGGAAHPGARPRHRAGGPGHRAGHGPGPRQGLIRPAVMAPPGRMPSNCPVLVPLAARFPPARPDQCVLDVDLLPGRAWPLRPRPASPMTAMTAISSPSMPATAPWCHPPAAWQRRLPIIVSPWWCTTSTTVP